MLINFGHPLLDFPITDFINMRKINVVQYKSVNELVKASLASCVSFATKKGLFKTIMAYLKGQSQF